jgi:hypothetical protein
VGRVVKDVATSDLEFDGDAGEIHPHALSTHTVTSVYSICSALLDWYAGVHEFRGMPWRKSYDPSLGQDGRSQRAYEVRTFSVASSLRSPRFKGVGFRDHAATDSSSHRRTLLQQMDEKVSQLGFSLTTLNEGSTPQVPDRP